MILLKMKNKIYCILLIINLLTITNSKAQSLNHTDLREFWDSFRAAATGGYGTTLVRLSSPKLSSATLTGYLQKWKANRCIMRGLSVTSFEELVYNPDLNHYALIVRSPQQGTAYFYFQTNEQSFYRFTGYEENGNINCLVGNTNNTNLYTKTDLLGTWVFAAHTWRIMPDKLRNYLSENGYDEQKMNTQLEERVKQIANIAPYNGKVQKVQFTITHVEVTTSEGVEKWEWKFNYNQILVKKEGETEWNVWEYEWHIDREGNFNLTYSDRLAENSGGDVKWNFLKRK
jgi:hypothetical protein